MFNRALRLRDDVVTDGNCRAIILSNAAVTEEDYFVAPTGNIPLLPKEYPDSGDSKGSDTASVQKKLHQKG